MLEEVDQMEGLTKLTSLSSALTHDWQSSSTAAAAIRALILLLPAHPAMDIKRLKASHVCSNGEGTNKRKRMKTVALLDNTHQRVHLEIFFR